MGLCRGGRQVKGHLEVYLPGRFTDIFYGGWVDSLDFMSQIRCGNFDIPSVCIILDQC